MALREIGVAEQPARSNRGPRVDQYTHGQPGPWCAHFVSWCFEQSGGSPFGHQSYVPSLREWAQRRGVYHAVGTVQPQRGDVLTMPRRDALGKLVGGHTGFVLSPAGDRVETVEGNIGDRVDRRTRPLAELDGFIRL